MDPMMIGIAVVVIVVILAGLFFVKKNRTSGDSTAKTPVVAHRPKTLAEQQRELEEQKQLNANTDPTVTTTPVTAVSSADKDLATAQQFIQQQDYNSAINTLRQSIKANPTRSDLHFSLLNTYALSKDYQSFDQFYPDVIGLNDANVTMQAQNLKNLIDEEALMQSAIEAKSANVKDEKPDALDFDLFDTEAAKPSTAPVVEELPISSMSQQPQELVKASNNATTEPDIDFDFDLEDVSSTSMPSVKTAQSQSPVDDLSLDELDFSTDLSIATTPTVDTHSHTEVFAPVHTEATDTTSHSQDNLADFDFDLPTTSIAKVEAAEQNVSTNHMPTEQSVVNEIAKPTTAKAVEDFDFDFDLPETHNESVATPVTVDNSVTTDSKEESFDLDFDLPEATHTAAAVNPVNTHETHNDNLLDDLEFNSETSSTSVTPNAETKPVIHESDLSFDLDDDFVAPQSQPEPKLASSDTVDQLDALYAQQPTQEKTVPTTPQPTADSDDFEFSLDDDLTLDDTKVTAFSQPSAAQPTIDEPVTLVTDNSLAANPVSDNLSHAFEFIKDLDTEQLNLDLAEQYISLGEYDSAKRLLNELNSSNPTLADKTKQLLSSIS